MSAPVAAIPLLALSVLFIVQAEEPAESPLTEQQIKAILRENSQRLGQVRRAQKRGETEACEKWLQEYAASAQHLNQAVDADGFEAADPEGLLWKLDAAGLKHRKLLERLAATLPEALEASVEEARAAARDTSRAALDALARLRRGELRVGAKGRGGIHQQREEEIWVPTPEGPQRRPRPRPQPPP